MNCGFVKIKNLASVCSRKETFRENEFRFLDFCKLGRFCVSLNDFMVNKL